ncbi:hypothetical protein SK128_013922 [Halocaridina rubra]|uniref:Uncharacterized protein n=1 Tax=Halocaridina rubra TaxID=373956 RepID=A0AAN8XM25_HALRR
MTALDPSKQGIEAQKLISISLGKMAASRVNKSGSSLHKSLLVASVLQRARNVFLEENYHSYHFRGPTLAPVPVYVPHVPPPPCPPTPAPANDENSFSIPQQEVDSSPTDEGTPTRVPFSDASNQQNQRSSSLKRRRCVSDKETQDAVSSILPKRFRSSSVTDIGDNEASHCTVSSDEEASANDSENVLIPISVNESSLLSVNTTIDSPKYVCANNAEDVLCESSSTTMNPIYCTLEPISDDEEDDDEASSMEVEHITSLVSIFSFGAPRKDLCATQAAREEPAQFTPVALAV